MPDTYQPSIDGNGNYIDKDKMGSIYFYNTNQCTNTGKSIYKVGICNSVYANSRIDSELNETLSHGKEAVFDINGGDIEYININTTLKTILELERLLHTLLDCSRIKKKELFYNTTYEFIKSKMLYLINEYGGNLTSYNNNKIDYLDGNYDNCIIQKSTSYNNQNLFLQYRANEFIGKTIKEIRNGNSIHKNKYKYGGSEKNYGEGHHKMCIKTDFLYIIGKTIIIE